jgi:hypothetical protein
MKSKHSARARPRNCFPADLDPPSPQSRQVRHSAAGPAVSDCVHFSICDLSREPLIAALRLTREFVTRLASRWFTFRIDPLWMRRR